MRWKPTVPPSRVTVYIAISSTRSGHSTPRCQRELIARAVPRNGAVTTTTTNGFELPRNFAVTAIDISRRGNRPNRRPDLHSIQFGRSRQRIIPAAFEPLLHQARRNASKRGRSWQWRQSVHRWATTPRLPDADRPSHSTLRPVTRYPSFRRDPCARLNGSPARQVLCCV
jgi:hypothetical protein